MARYSLGGPLSLLIGYFLAGWLNDLYGWRRTFAILGLPCLGLAVLAWLTLKEPRLDARSAALDDAPSPSDVGVEAAASVGVNVGVHSEPHFGIKETAAVLWRSATFRHLLFFFCIVQLFGSGILQWQPAFFVRSHGLKTAELGAWFAAIYGAGSALGMWLGGEWAARRARGKESLQLRATAGIYSAFAFVSAFIYLSPDRRWAFLLMGIAALGGAATTGPVFATIQTLVPARMRATSIAFLYLFSNLIGLGLGPLAAGVLSDTLRPHFGEESLRYALLALCPGYAWGAWHLWQASKTVARDLNAAKPEGDDREERFDADRCPGH
jgi:MFS family permease